MVVILWDMIILSAISVTVLLVLCVAGAQVWARLHVMSTCTKICRPVSSLIICKTICKTIHNTTLHDTDITYMIDKTADSLVGTAIGVGQKLSKLRQEILLVLEEFGHL